MILFIIVKSFTSFRYMLQRYLFIIYFYRHYNNVLNENIIFKWTDLKMYFSQYDWLQWLIIQTFNVSVCSQIIKCRFKRTNFPNLFVQIWLILFIYYSTFCGIHCKNGRRITTKYFVSRYYYFFFFIKLFIWMKSL